MRKLGRVLMWIGAFFFVINLGAYPTARQLIGKVNAARLDARANCGKLEEVLTSSERSAWPNRQQKAYDDLCDGPKGFSRVDVGVPIEAVLGFLGTGGVFYLIAIFAGATKRTRSA